MNQKEIEPVMDQVVKRFGRIWHAFFEKRYDETDREISELRDVLDDIYDREDEKPINDQKKNEGRQVMTQKSTIEDARKARGMTDAAVKAFSEKRNEDAEKIMRSLRLLMNQIFEIQNLDPGEVETQVPQ